MCSPFIRDVQASLRDAPVDAPMIPWTEVHGYYQNVATRLPLSRPMFGAPSEACDLLAVVSYNHGHCRRKKRAEPVTGKDRVHWPLAPAGTFVTASQVADRLRLAVE